MPQDRKSSPPGFNARKVSLPITPHSEEIKDLRKRNVILQKKVYNLEGTVDGLRERLRDATKK